MKNALLSMVLGSTMLIHPSARADPFFDAYIPSTSGWVISALNSDNSNAVLGVDYTQAEYNIAYKTLSNILGPTPLSPHNSPGDAVAPTVYHMPDGSTYTGWGMTNLNPLFLNLPCCNDPRRNTAFTAKSLASFITYAAQPGVLPTIGGGPWGGSTLTARSDLYFNAGPYVPVIGGGSLADLAGSQAMNASFNVPVTITDTETGDTTTFNVVVSTLGLAASIAAFYDVPLTAEAGVVLDAAAFISATYGPVTHAAYAGVDDMVQGVINAGIGAMNAGVVPIGPDPLFAFKFDVGATAFSGTFDAFGDLNNISGVHNVSLFVDGIGASGVPEPSTWAMMLIGFGLMVMVRAKMAIAAIAALIVTPASAHCYSIWNYPSPQHCGVASTSQVRVAVARVAAREEEPMPAPLPVGLRKPDIPTIPAFIAPTLNPPPTEWDDLILRAMGIDELKKMLAHER